MKRLNKSKGHSSGKSDIKNEPVIQSKALHTELYTSENVIKID